MNRAVSILFLSGTLATAAYGQWAVNAKQQNVQNCLDGCWNV